MMSYKVLFIVDEKDIPSDSLEKNLTEKVVENVCISSF